MFQNKDKAIKGMLAIIVALVLVVSIMSYNQYKNAQEEREQWRLFVNHFYFSMSDTIRTLDYLIESQPEGNHLHRSVRDLEKHLLHTDLLLQSASYYMDRDIYYTMFFQHASYFLYGINMTGTVEIDVPPIGETGTLTDEDLALLITLRDYLIEAKDLMTSEDGRQEDKSLTIHRFNNIMRDYLNHMPFEIYGDVSGTSIKYSSFCPGLPTVVNTI